MIVVTIVIDTDDASAVVQTMLKATKTLKVVELHVGSDQYEDQEEATFDQERVNPFTPYAHRARLVPMGSEE